MCDLLVLVGHSSAADSEQGNREFDEHGCVKISSAKVLIDGCCVVVDCPFGFDLFDGFQHAVRAQYL